MVLLLSGHGVGCLLPLPLLCALIIVWHQPFCTLLLFFVLYLSFDQLRVATDALGSCYFAQTLPAPLCSSPVTRWCCFCCPVTTFVYHLPFVLCLVSVIVSRLPIRTYLFCLFFRFTSNASYLCMPFSSHSYVHHSRCVLFCFTSFVCNRTQCSTKGRLCSSRSSSCARLFLT